MSQAEVRSRPETGTDSRSGGDLSRATAFLVGVGALVCESARLAGGNLIQGGPWEVVLSGVTTLAIWIAARQGAFRRLGPSVSVLLSATILGAVPYIVDSTLRNTTASGESYEFVQLAALRNLSLALFVVGSQKAVLRLACLLSMFVVLGAMALAQTPAPMVLAGVYGVVGLWWLMNAHWEEVDSRRAVATKIAIPKRFAASTFSLALALIALAATVTWRWERIGAIAGWSWSSGGDGRSDPYARRGERTGDQVVSATCEVDTTGAVDSELFVSDDKPSLFDVFNDVVGEPQVQKKTEDAVSLSSNNIAPEKPTVEIKAGGGESFSVNRQETVRPATSPEARDDAAVFLVRGRVPLHLRLATFNRFDGECWTRADLGPDDVIRSTLSHVKVSLIARGNDAWYAATRLRTLANTPPIDRHTIAVMNLNTNRVPTPAHATALGIKDVAREGFVDWHKEGCFHFPQRDAIPSSQLLRLESLALPSDRPARSFPTAASVSTIDPRVASLAQEWIEGAPAGMSPIDAIVKGLQARCRWIPRPGQPSHEHHSAVATALTAKDVATTTDDSSDAVTRFVLKTKSGPDYLFASAAVVMLQSQGYDARFASGFYASASRWRKKGDQTLVLPEDVHFWAEAMAEDGSWITVDPTPGFPALEPQASLIERMGRWMFALLIVVARNPLTTLVVATMLIGCFRARWRLLDAFATTRWRMTLHHDERAQGLAALAILERRFRWAGLPRPTQVTIRNWYTQWLAALMAPAARNTTPQPFDVALAAQARRRRWLDSAAVWLYSREASNQRPTLETLADCQAMLDALSLPNLEQLARKRRQAETSRSKPVGSNADTATPAIDLRAIVPDRLLTESISR